ncbi:MAG TPA: S8 family serine peptidase [Pseudonocardiaceae bacterium]|jgi:subtilase family serine protease|nr:S8 family serine peptidase [Pseudonocardiaceae bacterium]
MLSVRLAPAVGVLLACSALIWPAAASAAPIEPNTTTPQAAGLQPVCAGNLARLGCQVERVVANGPQRSAATSTAPLGWGPADLRKAHQIPTVGTHSGTIAIIDVGAETTLESDLNVYRGEYGMPACTVANGCFQQMDYHGGPALPPATTDENKAIDEAIAEETTLDVDMASAACPACHITEVQIPDSAIPSEPSDPSQPIDYDGYAQAFGDAVQTAVAHGASSISMSYGLPGDDAMLHGTIASDLDHTGVAITASSGDSEFNGSDFLWPSGLPTVTAVGGTELIEESGTYVEGAWSYGGSACTPGTSAAVGQPPSVSTYCGGTRAASDVSAVADDVAVYDTYAPYSGQSLGWIVLAGTSASAPFVAGVYAAAGHLSGVHGPNTLYRDGKYAFNDVTSGGNGEIGTSTGQCIPVDSLLTGSTQTWPNQMCQAQKGWDGPTGLGTPRGLLGF